MYSHLEMGRLINPISDLVSPEAALQVQALQDRSTFQAVTNSYAYPQIRRVASEATVALVFVNANSGEGYIEFDGNYGRSITQRIDAET